VFRGARGRGWGLVGQDVPEEIDIRIHAKEEER
jgi:hypothetical protein